MIPTRPGLYWRYGPNHDDEMVQQVVKVDYLSVNSEDLFYWEHGRLGALYIDPEGIEEQAEWEPVTPPVQSAHSWTCPHCGAVLPAYIDLCFHDERAEPNLGTQVA